MGAICPSGDDPLQQGLRPLIHFPSIAFIIPSGDDPLQQGLRPLDSLLLIRQAVHQVMIHYNKD